MDPVDLIQFLSQSNSLQQLIDANALIVTNIADAITEQDLSEYFSFCGEIKAFALFNSMSIGTRKAAIIIFKDKDISASLEWNNYAGGMIVERLDINKHQYLLNIFKAVNGSDQSNSENGQGNCDNGQGKSNDHGNPDKRDESLPDQCSDKDKSTKETKTCNAMLNPKASIYARQLADDRLGLTQTLKTIDTKIGASDTVFKVSAKTAEYFEADKKIEQIAHLSQILKQKASSAPIGKQMVDLAVSLVDILRETKMLLNEQGVATI